MPIFAEFMRSEIEKGLLEFESKKIEGDTPSQM